MSDSALPQELAFFAEPSAHQVGGKGMGLLHLLELGLRVPPAWVIPADAFRTFIADLGLPPQVEALERLFGQEPPRESLSAVRQVILSAPLPDNLLRELPALQARWAREFGGGIIVRSSATVEDSAQRSFAGIFESIPCYTNQEIEDAVRRIWASAFAPRAFAYYGLSALPAMPAMALVLQPFVVAERSGVMFTRFPGPDRQPQVLVEHVAGSGEKLVTGQVNPDRFWMPRWPGDIDDLVTATGDLSPQLALELAEVARTVEGVLGSPQDVEWCARDGRLYILQTRPITATGEAAATAGSGEVLLQGVAASGGQAGGAVHLVFNIEDADLLQVGQVLTTPMTNPDMVSSMQRSAAVVTDVGGMICHAAIVSRELGIPCIVGTKTATQTLAAGLLVTVDGSAGLVYRGQVTFSEGESKTRKLGWSDLWQDWQTAVPDGVIPLISTYLALVDCPAHIHSCVVDPFCDLALDHRAEIYPLAALDDVTRNKLLQSYVGQLASAVSRARLAAVFLDLHRLDAASQRWFRNYLQPESPIQPLEVQSIDGPWQTCTTGDGRHLVLLDGVTAELSVAAPENTLLAIPLGLGRLLSGRPIQLPDPSTQGPEGMFGMMPDVRLAPMPTPERREAMHRLVPLLAQAHGGQVPASDEVFPWLDLRPEVIITPFLKAFVTPGVEAIPFALGFDDPPLYIQFIRCRFHFRQDTLFRFFPKLMAATWEEQFLSQMLERCRDSYITLEALSDKLPAGQDTLARADNETLAEQFVAWWNAFTHFFNLSFFIQAQGDDCIFPALGAMAEANQSLLESTHPEWHIPGLAELSAPITPVMTAEYMRDLLALRQALDACSLQTLPAAEQAVAAAEPPALMTAFKQVQERWHWMRERDPYYDPYDSPGAILEKALSIQSATPPDYETNQSQAALSLALHFDLARATGMSEKLVYAIKYGRALAIDRENHHIVWLRSSYRLRNLLLEWERRLGAQCHLAYRDIFFLQPWEILAAVAALPQPPPPELLSQLRNRRLAYEREMQIKAGRESLLTPETEADYY